MVPIFFAFIPALFLPEMRRQGVVPMMGVFLGVCLVLGLLTEPMMGLGVLTVIGPILLIMDYGMRTDRSVEFTMTAATLLFMISFGFIFYRSGLLSAIQSGEFVKNIDSIQREVVANANLSQMEQARMIPELKNVFDQMLMLFPGLLVLSGALTAYLSYRIGGRTLRLLGEEVICPGPFSLAKLPRNGVYASMILLGVGFFAFKTFAPSIEIYVLNGLVVLAGLLMFQGLGIMDFYLLRAVRSPIVRGLVMAVSVVIPVGQMGLIAVGLIDQLIDIRGIQGV